MACPAPTPPLGPSTGPSPGLAASALKVISPFSKGDKPLTPSWLPQSFSVVCSRTGRGGGGRGAKGMRGEGHPPKPRGPPSPRADRAASGSAGTQPEQPPSFVSSFPATRPSWSQTLSHGPFMRSWVAFMKEVGMDVTGTGNEEGSLSDK